MTQISVPLCSRTGLNLGTDACSFSPGMAKGGFIAPISNCVVTVANMLDMKAFINAQLHHADPSKRWQPIMPYRQFDDLSKEAVQSEDGYGGIVITDDVKYILKYRMRNGFCYHRNLRTYNNQHEGYVYFDFDSNWVLQGTYHTELDTNGNYQMTGKSLELLFATAPMNANRDSAVNYELLLGYADTAEVVDEFYGVKLPFNPLKLKGVQEVQLIDVTPSGAAAGVYHAKALAGCGGTNLAADDTIAALLADVDAWTGDNGATGSGIDLDTVTRGATEDHFVLTFDAAGDADHNTGDPININLDTVAALEALGLKWYGNSLPMTRTML